VIARIQSLQDVSKGGLPSGWIGRIAAQVDVLKDTLATLEVGKGLYMQVDGAGHVRIDLEGGIGGSSIGNYGFRVSVSETGHVLVKAGTAQVWGGSVKTYAEADLGTATNGHYVYAVCDLTERPPAWENALRYDEMDSQVAGDELFVPIAKTTVASGVCSVTQMHWGNIVVPALANVVDVQTEESGESSSSGNASA